MGVIRSSSQPLDVQTTFLSRTTKRETGSQLGPNSRSQNFLLSEGSKSRGGESPRKGAAVVVLLVLEETGIPLVRHLGSELSSTGRG